ncbi:MAG: YlbF family regulator [Acholeplasmatales bacterium]|nr:YlbF family regulator [Acholeplasmatales bacterium]
MQTDIIDKAYILSNAIKDLDLYKELININNQIEENLKDKLQAFNKAKEDYNEALRYGEYHPSLRDYEQKLSEAKASLYKEELVKEYNKKYNELQAILDKMFDEIKSSVSNKFELSNNRKGFVCKK